MAHPGDAVAVPLQQERRADLLDQVGTVVGCRTVDAETDARIRAALAAGTDGATVILITHRIATLRHADCICVLRDGRIAEQGTHEQLLAQNGIYRRIWELQSSAGEEPDAAAAAGKGGENHG